MVDNGTGVIKTLPSFNHNIPTSSIFVINPPGKGYVIETDTRFTNHKAWLGSDYMLKNFLNDPSNMHKRLGDGYYEQRLVNEQINKLTGYRRLAGYNSDEAQLKALMDAGLTAAGELQLSVGIALTADQIARLTSDIVWMVSEQVTLPNGSVETVLVPKVYVVARTNDLSPSGSLISADSIHLDVTGLSNAGTIAGRKVVNINATNIANSGTIAGNKVGLTALDTIDIKGGQVIAGSEMYLNANTINVETTTITTGDKTNGSTIIDRVAGLYVTGDKEGVLSLTAQQDVNIKGAVVSNTATNGKTQIIAKEGDVNITTVDVASNMRLEGEKGSFISSHKTAEVGSLIDVKNDLTVVAGKEVNIRQSELNSTDGAIVIHGTEGVNITEGRQTEDFSNKSSASKKGSLKSVSSSHEFNSQEDLAVGSIVSGKEVQITSDKDVLIRGSDVVSDTNTTIVAGNDLTIEAAKNYYDNESKSQNKRSGLSSAGSGSFGFSAGTIKTNTEQTTNNMYHSGSMVGSLEGDVNLVAGNQYTQHGSTVAANVGDIFISGKSVDIIAAEDTYQSDYLYQYEKKGLTIALGGAVVAAAQAIQSIADSAEQVGKSKNDRVNAMAAGNVAMDSYQAYEAAKSAMGAMNGGDGSAISVSITYGQQKEKQTNETNYNSMQGSTVAAGGTTTILATGGGKDSNINIIGSDVSGGKGTYLQADNDINILAAEEYYDSQSKNTSSGWNAGIAVSFGKGASFGFTAGGNSGKGHGDESRTGYQYSHVGSDTGQTTIISGGTTNIIGGQVFGKGVDIIADELNIISVQEKETYNSRQENMSGQVTIGYGFSASASYNKSKIDSDYASVKEQSGIYAGDNGFNINVNGNTHLGGAIITSTEKAEKDGNNSLVTGTLTSQDIYNHSKYDGEAIGIGGGFSAGGGRKEGEKPTEGVYLADQGKFGTSSSMGVGSDSDFKDGITSSGVYTSNIIIKDQEKQQLLTGKDAQTTINDIKTNIDKDTALAQHGLENLFDAERVQKELDLQVSVSQKFDENRQEVRNDLYALIDKKIKEAEEERKVNGTRDDGSNGYDTDKSLALDAEAKNLKDIVKYLDLALGGINGIGNIDALTYAFLDNQLKLVERAMHGADAGQLWQVICDKDPTYCANNNQNDGDRKQIFDLSDIQANKDGVVTISNHGIFNSLEEAITNAVKQNKWETNADGVYVINNPETGGFISELLYAAYDKMNDLAGGKLPLSNAQMKNIMIFDDATKRGYVLDLSGHSRGGLTISVATQNALNNGMTNIPLREVRFFGTATNVQRYTDILAEKNNYVTNVYSSVHVTDFVGLTPWLALRSPYITGGNPATGGIGGLFKYSHSSYYAEIPEKTIIINGEKIDNPEYKEFVNMWGEPVNGINPSRPVLVVPSKYKK